MKLKIWMLLATAGWAQVGRQRAFMGNAEIEKIYDVESASLALNATADPSWRVSVKNEDEILGLFRHLMENGGFAFQRKIVEHMGADPLEIIAYRDGTSFRENPISHQELFEKTSNIQWVIEEMKIEMLSDEE